MNYKSEYHKKWYEKNKDKKLEQINQRRDEIAGYIQLYKGSRPCADCGKFYLPEQKHFDHLPGYIKNFEIADAKRLGISWEKVKKEIAKCDVVCIIDHRKREFKKQNKNGGGL